MKHAFPSGASHRAAAVILTLTFAVLLLASRLARADAMGVLESFPEAHGIVKGSMVSITLRFNAPVDHAHSTLSLKSEGGVRTLTPRLNGAPNYLYGTAGRLTPGAYEVVWKARSADGRFSSGTIPFTVE
jgi:methionine-rich copper-binding protein CopC